MKKTTIVRLSVITLSVCLLGSVLLFIPTSKDENYEKVRNLIQTGANIKCQENYSPLMLGIIRGEVDTVKMLVKAGADVNGISPEGCPYLILGANAGHTDIVRILVEAGADPNARDKNGLTALIAGSDQGHTEVVKMLIEAEAL